MTDAKYQNRLKRLEWTKETVKEMDELALTDGSYIATKAERLRYNQNGVIKQNFGDHNTMRTEEHVEFQKARNERKKIATSGPLAPSRLLPRQP